MAERSGAVTIRQGSGEKPPLFCLHAEAGDVRLYYPLASHLPPDQSVFGLPAAPTTALPAGQRLEQIAERHVHVIRAIQPHGPYLIVGECTGGALAYEVAQQLSAGAQEVALLALIDAFPPGRPRLLPFVPPALYRVVDRTRVLAFHARNVMRLGLRARYVYVSSRLIRAGRALSARLLRRLRPASHSPRLSYRNALASYRPSPYEGPVVLFRAARLPLGIEAVPDLGWGGLVERLTIETLPGYFTTPISEPGAQLLAQRLARHLSESTRPGRPG